MGAGFSNEGRGDGLGDAWPLEDARAHPHRPILESARRPAMMTGSKKPCPRLTARTGHPKNRLGREGWATRQEARTRAKQQSLRRDSPQPQPGREQRASLRRRTVAQERRGREAFRLLLSE